MTTTMTAETTETIPTEVLAMVRRSTLRLLEGRRAIREARYYATIISGTGRGQVDREEFLNRRASTKVTATQVREDRATLRQVAEIAEEMGIDGRAILGQIWADEKAALPKLRFELAGIKGISRNW